MPIVVKLAVFARQKGADESGVPFSDEDVKHVQFDHRPALVARPFDTEIGDFVPPQNDPKFIFAIRKATHDERTFGRKEGAERTVTTRGSDAGNAALNRRVTRAQQIHRYRLAVKHYGESTAAGMYPEVAALLARKSRARPIKSRGFAKAHRPLRRGA